MKKSKKKNFLRFIFLSPGKGKNVPSIFYTLTAVLFVVVFSALLVSQAAASTPTPLPGPEATATAQVAHLVATAQALRMIADAQARSATLGDAQDVDLPQEALPFAGGLLLGLALGAGGMWANKRSRE